MNLVDIFNSLTSLGYLGAFIISLLGTASIFLVTPYQMIIFGMGAVLNPLPLIILSALGAAIGEFVSYVVGYGGRKILKKKYKKYLAFGEKWFKKNGFLTVMIFAATPLPDDVVGLIAGFEEYDKKKYLLGCFIGKLIITAIIVFAGRYSIEAVLNYVGM